MKYDITLKNGQQVALDSSRISADDVRFPWESHPYDVRGWVIGHEHGEICLVFSQECKALDVACDKGWLTCFADVEGTSFLGNASEPHNLDYAWMTEVDWEKTGFPLVTALARAHASGEDLW